MKGKSQKLSLLYQMLKIQRQKILLLNRMTTTSTGGMQNKKQLISQMKKVWTWSTQMPQGTPSLVLQLQCAADLWPNVTRPRWCPPRIIINLLIQTKIKTFTARCINKTLKPFPTLNCLLSQSTEHNKHINHSSRSREGICRAPSAQHRLRSHKAPLASTCRIAVFSSRVIDSSRLFRSDYT